MDRILGESELVEKSDIFDELSGTFSTNLGFSSTNGRKDSHNELN